MLSYSGHALMGFVGGADWPSANLFRPPFLPYRIDILIFNLAIVLNFQELILLKTRHIPTHQQINALQANNGIISSTPSAKAYSLAERTQSIFVYAILIVLPETVLAELAITDILIPDFGIVLKTISSPDHISLGFSGFDCVKGLLLFDIWVR